LVVPVHVHVHGPASEVGVAVHRGPCPVIVLDPSGVAPYSGQATGVGPAVTVHAGWYGGGH